MGSGKGAPEYWVAEVRPGGILFEVTGVNKEIAEEALLFAGTKLGLRTEFVARSNFML
jgi:large subunit ribosomal protein L16